MHGVTKRVNGWNCVIHLSRALQLWWLIKARQRRHCLRYRLRPNLTHLDTAIWGWGVLMYTYVTIPGFIVHLNCYCTQDKRWLGPDEDVLTVKPNPFSIKLNRIKKVQARMVEASFLHHSCHRISPLGVHSSGRDVLWSDTLGRTCMLPENVSDAFLAKANIGTCHRPSPPARTVLLLPLALLSPARFAFSSCNLKIPNAFSLLLSASAKAKSCSADDAIAHPTQWRTLADTAGRCEVDGAG